MTSIRSVLAATDFSTSAGKAIQRAAQLAKDWSSHLTLLHVVNESALSAFRAIFPSPEPAGSTIVSTAQHMLNEQCASLGGRGKRSWTARVSVGQVLDEILLACAQADLLVLGAHGTNPLRDMLLGTTAERLLRKTSGLVLVVKRTPNGPYRRVMVPVDFSLHSAAALEAAAHLAPAGEIALLHAFEVPFEGKLRYAGVAKQDIQRYRVQARQQALSKIRALRDAFNRDAARIHHAVHHGNATRIIIAKEQELNTDLIVINRHAQSIVGELFLGSVTRHVLSDSKCDVLVVPDRPPATIE